ncbi:sugar transferase [Lutimonas halocynthiae]|uniref:sugar transferase n=1 Tax=Lutimonas halocynthiae TaxID=1446477 RepID=UPI0025B48485|nr:sugar transferase [Lutimonas halocynthiae]MDN3643392.1 sugar transferase [Lutimonas halocynthiae]
MITKLQKPTFFDDLKGPSYRSNFLSPINRSNGFPQTKKIFTKDEKVRIVIDGQSNVIPIEKLCQKEGISIGTFNKWTKEFLSASALNAKEGVETDKRAADEKFRVVIEGKSGTTSIAEICRRENITQEIFLSWCEDFLLVRNRNSIIHKLNNPLYQKNRELISNFSSLAVVKYCENYVNISSAKSLVVLKSNSRRLEDVQDLNNVVSLQKINDVRFVNKYLEKVNGKLENGGIMVGCFETFTARRQRMSINKIPVLGSIYFAAEFLIKRILPKVSFTKKYYFDITKGNDRLLSKAEGLGRLVSCGFSIMDYKTIDGILYFVVKKVREPYFDESPSYGPVYKMPRLGKNGKMIGVYKFRTMHPYSEYLQDYIVNAYGYAETGKPANDFRIPKWGKFMRRLWLDEIPQLFNVLKGELKLVGVRPVSERYFQDIPKEMQKLRLTQVPGCVPPYVALNREGNVMSVLQSEKEYLEEKIRNPYTTDMRYFLNAIFNIVFKHKRSA